MKQYCVFALMAFLFIGCQNSSKKEDLEALKTDQKFSLNPYTTINGVAATSGLIQENDTLYIIADNANVLYTYEKAKKELTKIDLQESGDIAENIPKAKKSDFEAITHNRDSLYIFGSGSSKIRNQLITYNRVDQSVKKASLDTLYSSLKSAAPMKDKNFNIEGAIIIDNDLLLFNRGNGPDAENGIFKITNWQNAEKSRISFFSIPLPAVQNTKFGFTDAVLIDDQIYFLAAAEASGSNYKDGNVLGSLLGVIDPSNMKIKRKQLISTQHKFEGLTLLKKENEKISFLLCEDPDKNTDESIIYKLSME